MYSDFNYDMNLPTRAYEIEDYQREERERAYAEKDNDHESIMAHVC